MSVNAAPILKGLILGIINQSKLNGFRSVDIGMQTTCICRSSLGSDSYQSSDGRADPVSSNDYFVICYVSILECDLSSFEINAGALS